MEIIIRNKSLTDSIRKIIAEEVNRYIEKNFKGLLEGEEIVNVFTEDNIEHISDKNTNVIIKEIEKDVKDRDIVIREVKKGANAFIGGNIELNVNNVRKVAQEISELYPNLSREIPPEFKHSFPVYEVAQTSDGWIMKKKAIRKIGDSEIEESISEYKIEKKDPSEIEKGNFASMIFGKSSSDGSATFADRISSGAMMEKITGISGSGSATLIGKSSANFTITNRVISTSTSKTEKSYAKIYDIPKEEIRKTDNIVVADINKKLTLNELTDLIKEKIDNSKLAKGDEEKFKTQVKFEPIPETHMIHELIALSNEVFQVNLGLSLIL